MSQNYASEHGDEITDEARLQFALAMSLEVDDDNDINEERVRRSLDSSAEVDMDNQTNAEQLQHALAMSMMDGNYIDEIGSIKATSIEPDGGNETDEERLQRALVMSTMDENGCEEFVASKDPSSNRAGRPILVVGSVYCLVANLRRQIASRP